MSRKKSREIVFRMLFGNGDLELACEGLEVPSGVELGFVENLYKTAAEHLNEIDETIKKLCVGFSFDRIFKTDLCAIRLGIAELKYTETNKAVIINEAVELAKRYGTEKSGGFVNGILAKVENE